MTFKPLFVLALGIWGSVTTHLFGAWTPMLTLFCCAMAVDYLTGLIVAGVFKRSNKTDSGKLESRAGWKGLVRKGAALLLVLLAHRLDVAIGTDYIMHGLAIGFTVNELISITENCGLMGLKLPKVLLNAIDVLNSKIDGEDTDD